MNARRRLRDETGAALVIVLLMALAVSAIVVASVRVAGNSELISRYQDRHSNLVSLADAAIEETRSLVNGPQSPMPDDGYVTVEEDSVITDADGEVIPGVMRSIWVGPTGITSGQYGVFASIVVEVEDRYGNRVVRRQEIRQESFAKYAYFTDYEPSNIRFGDGDEILGPMHTNSNIRIWSCCATFRDQVNTAGVVEDPDYGNFVEGYEENVAPIDMPSTADLDDLEQQALAGNTAFTGMATTDDDEATTRIEFVAPDIDGDGTIQQDEGFIRVYQVSSSSDAGYVTATYDYGDGLDDSENCGHYEPGGAFEVAADHPAGGPDDKEDALTDGDSRCFLGGAEELNDPDGFADDIGPGEWLQWPGTVDSDVSAARDDADYLFPISHQLNPDFKGVIFVDGDVALSGRLRGQVTVAATGDIILADDLTYATDPGDPDRSCINDDLLGLFAGEDVVVADNPLNAPVDYDGNTGGWGGSDFRTFDGFDDPYRSNEHFHGVVLALGQFTVENYQYGATDHEECEGQDWGRGCMYLTGGVIQESRGPVGTGSGTGYLKRYDYDACAAENPPPYYPTTGTYVRGIYYEIDPEGFDVAQLFDALSPS